ncbi:hypothetical protein IJM16_00540 [Candidatus Saccharibacteria bacterium]|nr:hypothetical protein [Candidatus Saccharibacteria bacterium]
MVIKMSDNINRLLRETKAAPGKAASHSIAETRREGNETRRLISREANTTRTTVIETGRHVEATLRNEANTTRTAATELTRHAESVIRNDGDTTRTVVIEAARHGERYLDRKASEITRRSDDNHAETRRAVNDGVTRICQRIDENSDHATDGQLIFSIICGLIAAVALWFQVKNAYYGPVSFDAQGNVLKYANNIVVPVVLCLFVGIATCSCVLGIVQWFENRHRR